jgi:hypothetical protein
LVHLPVPRLVCNYKIDDKKKEMIFKELEDHQVKALDVNATLNLFEFIKDYDLKTSDKQLSSLNSEFSKLKNFKLHEIIFRQFDFSIFLFLS